MVLDWLSRTHRPPTVDELVAKGRYAQAAAVLRTEIQDRTPTLPERLRLADLLVLADRGEQAMPILLGVADELARYGFHDRALEALRRADAIAPGREVARALRGARADGAGTVAAAEARGRHPRGEDRPVRAERPAPARRPRRRPEAAPRRRRALPLDKGAARLRPRPRGAARRDGDARRSRRALFADLQHYLFRRVADGLRRRPVSPGRDRGQRGRPRATASSSSPRAASASWSWAGTDGRSRSGASTRATSSARWRRSPGGPARPRSSPPTDCELLEIDPGPSSASSRHDRRRAPSSRARATGARRAPRRRRPGPARRSEPGARRGRPRRELRGLGLEPARSAALRQAHARRGAGERRARRHRERRRGDGAGRPRRDRASRSSRRWTSSASTTPGRRCRAPRRPRPRPPSGSGSARSRRAPTR